MPLDVAVFQLAVNRRSKLICEVMAYGIRRSGDRVRIRQEVDYRRPDADVAVFYGYIGNLPRIMREYKEAGRHAVYIDLGYWGRHQGGRWTGYHKVAVDARHPTAYFQNRPHSGARAAALGIFPKEWREKGDHVVIAGMSDKAAHSAGFRPEEWERSAIAELRRHTDRTIIYRPKPSWKDARPIEGTEFSPGTQDLGEVLENCHAIVTHHSNVAVDAIVEGIPAFCWEGVGSPLASQSLAEIETPRRPAGRTQWVADVSFVQFTIDEMRAGMPWAHLKNEGLLS